MIFKKKVSWFLVAFFLFPSLSLAGDYIDIFSTSENIWIWDVVQDRYGQPWENATCNLTVLNFDSSINTSVIMQYMGNGIFNQSVGVFREEGYYPMKIQCTETDGTGTVLSGNSDRIGFRTVNELSTVGVFNTTEAQNKATIVVGLVLTAFVLAFIGMQMEKNNIAMKLMFILSSLLIGTIAVHTTANFANSAGFPTIMKSVNDASLVMQTVFYLFITLFVFLFVMGIIEKMGKFKREDE